MTAQSVPVNNEIYEEEKKKFEDCKQHYCEIYGKELIDNVIRDYETLGLSDSDLARKYGFGKGKIYHIIRRMGIDEPSKRRLNELKIQPAFLRLRRNYDETI